jgi:hypothetical protein
MTCTLMMFSNEDPNTKDKMKNTMNTCDEYFEMKHFYESAIQYKSNTTKKS